MAKTVPEVLKKADQELRGALALGQELLGRVERSGLVGSAPPKVAAAFKNVEKDVRGALDLGQRFLGLFDPIQPPAPAAQEKPPIVTTPRPRKAARAKDIETVLVQRSDGSFEAVPQKR